jgi:hypothetical protein
LTLIKGYFTLRNINFNPLFPPIRLSDRDLISQCYFPTIDASSHKVLFKLSQIKGYFTLDQLNLNFLFPPFRISDCDLISKFYFPTIDASSHKVLFKLIQIKGYFTLDQLHFNPPFSAIPSIRSRSYFTILHSICLQIFAKIFI